MSGRPQTLTKGQEEIVVRILRKTLLKYLLIGFTVLAGITGMSLREIYLKINGNMRTLVAQQFEEPRVQQVTREAASEKASALLEQQIQPEVNALESEINRRQREFEELLANETRSVKASVADLEHKTGEADRIFDRMQKALSAIVELQRTIAALTSFQTVLMRAQNDDRYAYKQIVEWEEDGNSPIPMHDLVKNARANLCLQYFEQQRVGISFIQPKWLDGVDPNTLSLAQIASGISNGDDSWLVQPGAVHYIWNREDYPKEERIQFLIDVLRHYRNLKAVNMAGQSLSKESGIKWNPFQIEPFVQWWDTEKRQSP